jgi:hypothetical protein
MTASPATMRLPSARRIDDTRSRAPRYCASNAADSEFSHDACDASIEPTTIVEPLITASAP